MITSFWNWITSTVSFGLQTLNNFINNETTGPFFDLLLVVLLMGILIKFVIVPLIGNNISGRSDKAKRKEDE